MSDTNRLFFLRIALIAIGLTFIFGIYTLGIVWPSGWVWSPGHPQHNLMMRGVCDPWGVSHPRIARSLCVQEHHLVHRVVEHCSWGHHGCTVPHRWGRTRSFDRRRSSAFSRCDRSCSVDAANEASLSDGSERADQVRNPYRITGRAVLDCRLCRDMDNSAPLHAPTRSWAAAGRF